MDGFEIRDVGPIVNQSIPVPEGGGVMVLKGRNGSGKTTALNAVESLVAGKNLVAPRDGCVRGEVDGCGATLRLGRKASRSGELEVISLEGKLSPADLVDPGLKSDEAADAVRIKSLLQLVGAKPDLAPYYALVGGQTEFDEAIPDDLSMIGDAVALSAKIKRGFEAAARRCESVAENEAGKSAAYKKAGDGLDLSIETDVEVLQSRLEGAVAEQSRLITEAAAAEKAAKQAAEARETLASSDVVAFADFAKEIAELETELANTDALVETFEKELSEAQQREKDARRNCEESKKNWQSIDARLTKAREQSMKQQAAIQSADNTRKTCEDLIAAAESMTAPTIEDVESAAAVVRLTRQALEHAAIVRKAQEQIAKGVEHEKRAKDFVKHATKLRDAATATDTVLSDIVSRCGTPLCVRGDRLWLETKRGMTRFCELSHGERWRVAIDVALQAFPQDSEHMPILTVPQESWESLDPTNRKVIAEHAITRGVLVLTAECSDGPLSVEQFDVSPVTAISESKTVVA